MLSFPARLHQMLTDIEELGRRGDKSLEKIVSFLPHGRAWMIHDRKAFIDMIMPIFFFKQKFISFQRQLLLFGFQRITADGPDKGAYYHQLFIRSCPELARQMTKAKKGGKSEPQSHPRPSGEANSFYNIGTDCLSPAQPETSTTNPDFFQPQQWLIPCCQPTQLPLRMPQPYWTDDVPRVSDSSRTIARLPSEHFQKHSERSSSLAALTTFGQSAFEPAPTTAVSGEDHPQIGQERSVPSNLIVGPLLASSLDNMGKPDIFDTLEKHLCPDAFECTAASHDMQSLEPLPFRD
jgi:hypothetical protein